MKKISFIILVLLIILSSCENYKRITYLQTPYPEKDTVYKPNLILYKLQPADILYVNVLSIDKNVTELFNSNSGGTNSQSMGTSGGGMYFMGYSIDKNGMIHLPVIGDVQVGGLSIDQAKKDIQKIAEIYIKDARIELKLVSFKITMLGEINHPGQVTIFNDKANILEAIALGGDVSYYGNRKKILVIRATEGGGVKTFRIDLTNRDLLKSDQFYVQPNDILYVEPLKSTAFRMRLTDYTTLLTLLTTVITTFLLIYELIKY